MPPVQWLTEDEASTALAQAKLALKTTPRDGPSDAGRVLAVQPAPGTVLSAGAPVTLVVASGRNTVPDVRGTDQQQAIDALAAAGFAIGIRQVPSTLTPGTVLDQSIVNKVVDLGTAVVLDVAVTPPPAG